MEITKNGLKKPAQDDFYNVDDFNNNTDIVEEHLENTDIHVSASEIGNIKEADELTQIINSDDNSKMWGKIKKLITDFLSHIKTTATGSVLGHVKLSDTYATKVANGAAKDGLGASQNALYEAYNKLNTDLDTTNTELNNTNFNFKNYLPTNGGTITGNIIGSEGGYFSTNGNVYIKSGNYNNWLSILLDAIELNKVTRTSIRINNFSYNETTFAPTIEIDGNVHCFPLSSYYSRDNTRFFEINRINTIVGTNGIELKVNWYADGIKYTSTFKADSTTAD